MRSLFVHRTMFFLTIHPFWSSLQTASTATLDGGWNFGHVVARRAMELAIEKAAAANIAIVSLVQLHHIGRVGYYSEMAAAAGMAALEERNKRKGWAAMESMFRSARESSVWYMVGTAVIQVASASVTHEWNLSGLNPGAHHTDPPA